MIDRYLKEDLKELAGYFVIIILASGGMLGLLWLAVKVIRSAWGA